MSKSAQHLPWSIVLSSVAALFSVAASPPAAAAGLPGTWTYLRPTNTGLQGDYANSVLIDSADRPWVAANDPVWIEGGVACLDNGIWSNWSTVDGRSPTDRITNIKFDSRGILWGASSVGLLTLDGKSVHIAWSKANAPWPTSEVSDFAWDGKGNLWVALSPVGNVRGGLAKYDGTSWTVYTTATGLPWPAPWDQVSAVAVDAQDRIWIGSPVQGGAMYDGKKWTWMGPSGATVRNVVIAPTGTPWYAFDNWGVRTWEGKNRQRTWIDHTLPFGQYDISHVVLDRKGDVWVTTYVATIAHWNLSGWQPVYQTPNLSHVYGLAFDSQGRAWASGIGGLAMRDSSGAWTVYDQENTGLTSRFLNDIFVDAAGNRWFASSDYAVSKFDGVVWTDFNHQNWGAANWPFTTDVVYQTVQDAAGNLWFALGPDGIGEMGAGGSMQALQGYDIRSVAVDAAGYVWAAPAGACYWDQVFRFDGTSWTPMGNPGDCAEFRFISGDAAGNVWLAAYGGLMKYDGLGWTWFTTANSGLPDDFVNVVKPDPSGGAVWVGTRKGLARFDGASWTVYTKASAGLASDNVVALSFGPGGELWAAAWDFDYGPPPDYGEGGVSRLDATGWTTWTTANSGLPHLQVETLAVDAGGRIWIGPASKAIAVLVPSP